MIRERVPLSNVGVVEERIQVTYRLWFCCYCGIDFSIRAQVRPLMCPACLTEYNALRPPLPWLERFTQRLRGVFLP